MAGNMISSSLALLLLSQFAIGAVTPTAPGPGEVFAVGSECSVSWTPDQSGKWKSFTIDLMSGSNSNMTLVANVAESLDGSDPSLSPYTWTCPDVDPYSTVYFYQFSAAADESNTAWTTRFTITSPSGETTAPPHSKQSNGDDVPWGSGALRSGSSVASREKHKGGSSSGEEDSDESYSIDDRQATSQGSSNNKAEGGAEYDEEVSSTGTNARKGGSGTSETSSSEDSEDPEVLEDNKTSSSTDSGSSDSTPQDTEEGTKDSGAADFESSGTEGSVYTSSRLKTVHSKPTSTPLSMGNLNAATPTLPMPSTPLPSAQPVGCAGGTNASSSYCSAPTTANHATYFSKLDSRACFAAVLFLAIGLL